MFFVCIGTVNLIEAGRASAALRQHPNAERVEVTDLLAGQFKPKENQLKVIESIKTQKPLPLEECRERVKKGEIQPENVAALCGIACALGTSVWRKRRTRSE